MDCTNYSGGDTSAVGFTWLDSAWFIIEDTPEQKRKGLHRRECKLYRAIFWLSPKDYWNAWTQLRALAWERQNFKRSSARFNWGLSKHFMLGTKKFLTPK